MNISTSSGLILIISLYVNHLLLVTAQTFADFARDLETNLLNTRIPDTIEYRSGYDFIIIGAGSGGCVLANRLSELKNVTVLLLEAGDQETFLSDVPLTAALTQITRYNWGYKPDPTPNACQGLKDGRCNWPKGRGVGGTSLINFLLYSRGHRQDYDEWSALGNNGWSYREVLPYFKKSENIKIPELRKSKYHGRDGPLDVTHTNYKSKVMKAFLKSGLEMGYNLTDINGEQLMGFSRTQATIRNGRRCSTSKAFIKPIIGRRNLHISMLSRVTRIIIDPLTKQANAVEFIKNRKRFRIVAKKEIILAAGAIASPQLLMLSGVGPAQNLQKFNIPVLKNLSVGYNLQDHITLNGLLFVVNESTINDRKLMNTADILQYILQGSGPYTIPGGAEAFAFVRTPSSGYGKFFKNDIAGKFKKVYIRVCH